MGKKQRPLREHLKEPPVEKLKNGKPVKRDWQQHYKGQFKGVLPRTV